MYVLLSSVFGHQSCHKQHTVANQSEDIPSKPIRWKPKSILIELAPFLPRLQPVFVAAVRFIPVLKRYCLYVFSVAGFPCLFALIMLLIKKVVVLF